MVDFTEIDRPEPVPNPGCAHVRIAVDGLEGFVRFADPSVPVGYTVRLAARCICRDCGESLLSPVAVREEDADYRMDEPEGSTLTLKGES